MEKLDLMINLKATELRLGLPGTHDTDHDHDDHQSSSSDHVMINNISNNKKRSLPNDNNSSEKSNEAKQQQQETTPPAKAQIVGWPPVRAYRKNSLQKKSGDESIISEAENISGIFVKVGMDGAPFLRKIDLRVYKNYPQLLKALESMFKFTIGEYSEREGYKGSDFVPTYEDKDGDWMLVGDVPWDMFMSSCKRMRIMRESEARGLGCGV